MGRTGRKLTAALGTGGMWLLFTAPSLAAGGGGGGGGTSSLEILLLLVAVVGVGYLVAHLLLERVAEKFGLVTGVEYIVLGAIVFRVIIAPIIGSDDATAAEQIGTLMRQLGPVLLLGTGSLGLLWGTHADFRNLDEIDRASMGPALAMSLVTFGVVAGVPALVIPYFYSLEYLYNVTPLLICAGAIAMVAGDDPIRSMVTFLGAEGVAPVVAARAAGICSWLAIIAFGLLFCIDHPPTDPGHPAHILGTGPMAWLGWLVIHVILGVALGIIFGTFLRRDFSDEKILTVVIGMVVFTSGIAYGLTLSPIFVNFVLGVVLINTCRHGDHVRKMLDSIKHPLYIVLFIFAGAELNPNVPLWAWALAGPFLLLRLAGRWLGGLVSQIQLPSQPRIPSLHRVLFAPGALSIAMSLDFLTVYLDRYGGREGPFFGTAQDVQSFYASMIVAVLVSEILSYALTRSWLIDAADVSPDREEDSDEPRDFRDMEVG